MRVVKRRKSKIFSFWSHNILKVIIGMIYQEEIRYLSKISFSVFTFFLHFFKYLVKPVV